MHFWGAVLSGQEFKGEPFTHSWIYGVYGGRVTFWEQMIALDFLQTNPNTCSAIKAPPAVDVSGYYPTQQCIRHDASADAYVVSLEGFVYREASPSAGAPGSDGAPAHRHS